ncbi:superoxide dismutase [Fe] 2, chloroplastic [Aegilops tauschii subsp. strangulata]|uniref:Superoxide dismutase n=2 Tax=Aegilops tauschii subsp. strangulata TaxID=200361 RepID=A0A453QMP4_AEGTS|nr:superoxide dismutase [Fe] 2, chloroplastic [Aegilops tauschii subsp. strangulata]
MLLPVRGLPAAPHRPLTHPHSSPAPPPSLLGARRRRPSRRLSKVVSYYGLTTPPYKTDALEPYMSRRAVELHWGKHQQEYVDGLNRQLAISPLYGHTLEDLIKEAYNNGNPLPEYNDAAEVWNHHFFWESMQPEGGGSPEAGVLQQIEKDFGSFFNFREEFMRSALSLLGSGWVWLVLKRSERKLEVVHTRNAINPLAFGDIPIISLDLWEHAYYLDYKDDRRTYVSNFLDHLVSWHTVTLRMMRAEAFVNLGEPTIPVA